MTPGELRVLLLTDSDVFAGTERHILELAQALGGMKGCQVTIGAPGSGKLAERARAVGCVVFPVEKRGRFDLRAVVRLWRALRRREFNLIHTHNGRTALLTAVATLLAGRGHLVVTQHFLTPAHALLGGWKFVASSALHRWIANRAARMIAISQAVRDSIAARQAAPANKVRVVVNGVSDPQCPGITPRATVRTAFSIPEDAPLVVSSVRLEKEKGLNTLIEAMSTVTAQLPSARCLVAGEGAARQSLQAKVDAHGLGPVVRFVGFQEDIFSLIGACDVFVLPSPNEPFGLALIEAMALARPVIASRAGGPREIVDEDRSGLLFIPGDALDLAAAIVRVLTQPTLAARLATESRRVYLERFTARRMAEESLAIYREAIGQPPSGRI